MKHTRALTTAAMAVSSLGLAALLGGPAVSSAKPGPTPSPSPTSSTPAPPAAVGCYDIVPSTNPGPNYRRFVDKITGTPSTTYAIDKTYSGWTVTLSNNGTVHADIPLGGAACTDATYVLSIYDSPTGQPIASAKVQGDGVATFVPVDVVLNDHPGKTVYVQATVQDNYGRTIDALPAAPKDTTAKDDGSNGSGGSAFWG